MKTLITATASALALLSLGGCATQSQIDQQNAQLALANISLMRIQANQVQSIALHKSQVALLELSNTLLIQQLKAKRP
jgi:murein lipoprotein